MSIDRLNAAASTKPDLKLIRVAKTDHSRTKIRDYYIRQFEDRLKNQPKPETEFTLIVAKFKAYFKELRKLFRK